MKRLVLSSLCVLSPLVQAAEEKKFSADLELGIISTSGNTETNSLKGKMQIKQNLEKFRNNFIANAFYKEDQVETEENDETVITNQVTAEKYFFSAQSDYKLNKKHRGLFIYGSYEQDEFSGYEYQATVSLGYSDRLFNFDRSHLDYSVGPGISFRETEDTIDDNGVLIEGEETQSAVVRIALEYLYQISDNAKFTQSLASEVSVDQEENTKTKSETALTANITSGFALKASFIVDQNTHVPEDKKHADTQTALTFVYSF